jgi:uncharacterized protein (TIGR02453 family)
MDGAFAGFGPGVFAWFEGLERDNSKAYFTATRDVYEAEVRGGLIALLEELAATLGGDVRVFRQQRDLRFSADRTPYKTRTYGILQDPEQAVGGLYAELSARGLYAGAGFARLARDQLARFRAAVDDARTGAALAEAAASARAAGLEVAGRSLRTAPRGVPRDRPRIDLLRHTALFAGSQLPGARGISRDAALAHVAGTWRAAGPLVAWLEAHVGPSALALGPRGPSSR